MTRKMLDITLSAGGAILALLLLVLGFVLADQAAFAKDYVKEELGSQRITFATEEELAADAKANPANPVGTWKEGSACLTDYAGKALETGKQAECYGKYYIGMHMSRSAKNLKFSAPIDVTIGGTTQTLTTMEGQTYATIGTIRTALAADQKALTDKGDKAAADARQKDVDAAASLRTTMQTGETLKGLLLTSFGFSIFGEKAGLAADVCYLAAVLLVVLALAGFAHAFFENRKTANQAAKKTNTVQGGAGLEAR